MLGRLISISLLVFSIGCANGNCKLQKQQQSPGTEKKETAMPTSTAERVKVFKLDGSLQCGMGKATALNVMAKELKDIKIYQSFNKNDGQMRVQVCGAPTGNCNVYEIDRAQLDAALKFGFKEWIYE